MIRVAMITIGNLYRLPYIRKYVSFFPEGTACDIFYWNREGKDTEKGYGHAEIKEFIRPEKAYFLGKLWGYLFYRRFIIRGLKKGNYDRLIVVPTPMALLLADVLVFRYAGRYLMDVRDYCREHLWLVRMVERILVRHSKGVVVSSRGFLSFLPNEGRYVVCHNDRSLNREQVEDIKNRPRSRSPITIGFVGYVGYHSQQCKLIDLFGNDERFQLLFAGAGGESLREYCIERLIRNVTVRSEFRPEDVLGQYEDVDIIDGIYGPNSPELIHAVSNKLYFAVSLRMPIVCAPGTEMARISSEFDIGTTLDMQDPNAPDKIAEYYRSINWNALDTGCSRFEDLCERENRDFKRMLTDFLQEY